MEVLYSDGVAHATETANSSRQQAGISRNSRPKPACSPVNRLLASCSWQVARGWPVAGGGCFVFDSGRVWPGLGSAKKVVAGASRRPARWRIRARALPEFRRLPKRSRNKRKADTIMQSQESPSLQEELKDRLTRWILISIDPLLLIGHLTLIYVVALKADEAILTAISSSFDDLVKQSSFAAQLLLGLKLFSALGVAFGYGLHTVYQLYLEGKHVVKVLKEETKTKTETDI